MVSALTIRSEETGAHIRRVGRFAALLARRAGVRLWSDDEICLAAMLHDVGKIGIPDSILLKPGRFTPEERAIMEKHCEHGWELIGEGGLAQLFVAQEIALNHHERWDGTGYPNRRQGSMIPLAARVTALADVFDALTHRRCYKPAWSIDDALREIASLRGKHFDPELTDLFLELVPDLRARQAIWWPPPSSCCRAGRVNSTPRPCATRCSICMNSGSPQRPPHSFQEIAVRCSSFWLPSAGQDLMGRPPCLRSKVGMSSTHWIAWRSWIVVCRWPSLP